METILIILCVLIAVIVVCFVILIVRAKFIEMGHAMRVVAKVDTVVEKLGDNLDAAGTELRKLAENPETRNTLYDRLTSTGNAKHFPAEFHNPEAFAESDLVFWLCHPNELKTAPDEIELTAKIKKKLSDETGEVEFFVFRFRVNEPHWAAEYGWMAGITGPYVPGDDLETRSWGTFSKFEPYDTKTPADHVDYLVSKQGSFLVTKTNG